MFTHLHLHTEYSLLDGCCRIEKLLDAVAARRQKSVAITDHGVMYGCVTFFEECKKEGLLVVPSDSFGIKGYVRIAYCVTTDRIINSAPHFKEVAKKCGLVK